MSVVFLLIVLLVVVSAVGIWCWRNGALPEWLERGFERAQLTARDLQPAREIAVAAAFRTWHQIVPLWRHLWQASVRALARLIALGRSLLDEWRTPAPYEPVEPAEPTVGPDELDWSPRQQPDAPTATEPARKAPERPVVPPRDIERPQVRVPTPAPKPPAARVEVPAAARPAPRPAPVPERPVIGLAEVQNNLRSSYIARKADARPSRPQVHDSSDAPPVIGLADVRNNLRGGYVPAARRHDRSAAAPARSVTLIEPNVVRARVQVLHKDRLQREADLAAARRRRLQPAMIEPVRFSSPASPVVMPEIRSLVTPEEAAAEGLIPLPAAHESSLSPSGPPPVPAPASEPVTGPAALSPATPDTGHVLAWNIVDDEAEVQPASTPAFAWVPPPPLPVAGPAPVVHELPPTPVTPPWRSSPAPVSESPSFAAPATAYSTVQAPPAEAWPPAYGDYALPPLSLLMPADDNSEVAVSEESMMERGIVIEEKLAEFKVKVRVVDAYAGPVITRYEVEPDVGVRGNQVVNLVKDLSRALGLASIRVVETIPGKTCMGLELPNPRREMIRLSEILSDGVFQRPDSRLTLALGKDITGQPVTMNLGKAPHLLVAGTTGSGKSVGVNAMILSLLYKATPEEVRFIMIDPKMLELSVYNDIPHLLAPVVTDMKLAANALNWCVAEMEKRYRLMSALGVRNLDGFNQKLRRAEAAGRRIVNPFTLTPDDPEPLSPLPFIVVVVDEFADLMMVAGKKIEELIARLAQKARAAGIHLILATQRPSVDVITGLIKANIPTRIAFQVSSKVDSRTILDQMGAESLLGQGDMLYLPPGTGYPQRVHGAFVADEEVHAVVEYLKQFGEPDYIDDLLTGGAEAEDAGAAAASGGRGSEEDPLYDEAVAIVLKTRKASISSVQRQLRIGYNRAARLIEQMEEAGMVSPMESNGNRTVLVPDRG
ncbi:DNA translocase FtsK [Microvirgula curvata]